MSKKDFRGKINALHYDPKLLSGPAPAGDWIVHYHFDGDWKVKAVKVNY